VALQFSQCAQHNPVPCVQLGLAEIIGSCSCVAVSSSLGVHLPQQLWLVTADFQSVNANLLSLLQTAQILSLNVSILNVSFNFLFNNYIQLKTSGLINK
jgi:hypothetical protein